MLYIQDILDSIMKLEEYINPINKSDFYENSQIQDAVIRRLEIIGEAVKNINQEIKNKYPEIPWKQIAGMRDVIVHEYFGVNLERTWKTLKSDIPDLKDKILKVKSDLDRKSTRLNSSHIPLSRMPSSA